VPASELELRDRIKHDTWDALRKRDFAALERTAAAYRDPAQRTPSGTWKLSSFYIAAANYLTHVGPCLGDRAPADSLFAEWNKAVPDSPTLTLVRANHRLCMAYPPGGELNPLMVEAVLTDLNAHRALADTDPYWSEVRLRAAGLQALPDTAYNIALQRSIQKFPDFPETWFRAVDMARWQEDVDEEIAAIARTAQGTGPIGQELYARIYWYAASKHYGDALFEARGLDWAAMKIGFDDILGRYPDAWNLNNFARFACLKGDREKTAELMRRIGDKPVRKAWPSQAVFDACREGRFGDTPITAMR
jgi:hypothetical protein